MPTVDPGTQIEDRATTIGLPPMEGTDELERANRARTGPG